MATAFAPKPSVVTEERPAFRWLRTGDEALECLLSAIDQARESIRLETYIYRTGQTGERFRAALISACDRGVKVRVMIDALGSFSLPETFWTPLREAGAQCTWFNPLALGRWSYRDHRKMLVCDDAVAFIGGFNIADEYHGDGVTHGWRDLGLEIRGSRLVRALAQSFDAFFDRAVVKHKRLQRFRKAPLEASRGKTWQFLVSGPGRYHGPMQQALRED